MANQQIQLNPIKYLNNLPLYSGSKKDLNTFTKLIDRIHPLLITYDEISQLIFSDIIKSRLIGKAQEIIEINTQARSWQEIKTVLENNFGERKSCEELFDDLRSVTFSNTTLDFFNEIKFRLRLLNNKAAMIMGEGEGLNQVALNNQKSALHIFKNKMPEPMRTVLACRNPNTLESAMDILFESGYDKVGKDGFQTKYHKLNRDKEQNYRQQNRQNSNERRNNNHREYQQQTNQRHQDNDNSNNYQRRWNDHPNNYQRHWNNNNQQNQNRRFYSNQLNYNSTSNNQPQQRYPEPMEVNTVENFQHTASRENYPI